jgi:hypothetical protein
MTTERLLAVHLVRQSAELNLHSRRLDQIKNLISWTPVHYGVTLQVADFKRQYSRATHRPVSPSRKYNCHGLTFASRRTWIDEAPEIRKILADDEYVVVSRADVLPGDVVVYYVNGDPEHSGVVVGKDDMAGPLILSKWGVCHEVIHWIPDCPYDAGQVVFYRITT